jgi:arginyl-tRNA synthetase
MSVPLNFQAHLHELFSQATSTVLDGQSGIAPLAGAFIERSRQALHGDYACNLAMQLAKPLRKSPRDIAQALIAALPHSEVVEKVEIAGAGFINVFITAAAKQMVVKAVLQAADDYGHSTLGAGRKVQVEFVSANPTGPLHVGHGRGAAYGASLANVLEAAGYKVSREYYVNDAGRQMDILAVHGCVIWSCMACLAFQATSTRAAVLIWRSKSVPHWRAPRALPKPCRMPPATEDADAHLDALIANAKRLLGED